MSEQTPQPMSRHEFETRLIVKALKDEAFKQELIRDPKSVYSREMWKPLPESIKNIHVLEETPDTLYLVIPRIPSNVEVAEEVSEETLEAVAGGGQAKPDTVCLLSCAGISVLC